MRRPVAVTGIGIWCSIGRSVPEFWEGLMAGRNGVCDLTRFPAGDMRCPRVAEAPDPGGSWPNLVDRLALPAAREAMAQAGMERLPEGAGVAMGACVGGLPESEEAFIAHLGDGRFGRKGRLRAFLGHMPATTGDLIAAKFGATGPRSAVTTACSSSTVALGQGGMWIAEGEADCVLSGASDALSMLTVGGFNAIRVVTPTVPRPFDKNRSGMVVGEGAAFLVLESLERAQARGARVLALLEGFGLSVDAYHATAPDPEGNGALAAMARALASAGSDSGEVDHVNAHGTGTVANDGAEAKAIARLLGDRTPDVPVISLKGALGHGLGSAGAMEAVASVLTLLHQTVPPSVGFREADPALGLFVPKEPLRRPVRKVLSVNLAFGGNNAAVLLGREP